MDGYDGARGASTVFATPSHHAFAVPSIPPPPPPPPAYTPRMPYEPPPTPSGLSQLAHLLAPAPPLPTSTSGASPSTSRKASVLSPYNPVGPGPSSSSSRQRSFHPASSPRAPSKSPRPNTSQGRTVEDRHSASASQSDSGSNAGSRMEASSPFDDDEDDEDEDEDGDDLVEEEAPIDWSAIDANAFFQNWLLPGGMNEQQEQQPQSQQQTAPANFGTSMLPQQMYTPNGSLASDHTLYNHEQQSQQQQQEQQTQSGPAASPNLSAAIEILTKVLGEGQEVPSQVLEMLLQSVAPTLGYQPPTPSQEPGIDSLVPILKDLIKKQQQQEQQQMQNESTRGGNSLGDGGHPSWSSVIPQPRTSAVGASPMPNVSYSSMTPHNQPFNWIPLATPADDDEEDDEDKDPSYNPTMLTGALGIQDALQEQMSQYLNSPFAVTPTGAISNRPSPLPQSTSLPPSHTAAATTSVRSSPRKAQAMHRRLSAGSGVGKQSTATTARTGINAAGPVSPSPASESRLGPQAEARQKASGSLRTEAEAGSSWGARGSGAMGSKSKKRSRADTYDSEEERRQPVREASRDDPDGTPPRRGTAGERNKPRASNASSRRGARGRIEEEEEEEEDDLSLSPSRSPSASRSSLNGRTDSPTPSPVKKPSNAGRKPIFDTEEERKAQRAKQNRLYQQEYRARKRAEKDVKADRRAGAPATATASATGKGKTSAAGSTAGQGKGQNNSNGYSKSAPKSASSATAHQDAARLREDYGELREENAELKAEQRLLRAEMERLRRENVELRVEVEVSRRLALGSSNADKSQGGARVVSRNRGSAGGPARRAHRRSELEQDNEEDAHSSDQEGSARSEDFSDSEPDDRDVSGFSRRRGDGRPSSKTVEKRAGGKGRPDRARDRERDRDRDRGSGRPHASSRGYR